MSKTRRGDFVNARLFGNLANVDRTLTEALAHRHDHTAKVRAELHGLPIDDGDPLVAMSLEQFRQ